MKKIFNVLYSTRLTAILFFLFAAAMGVATFIENDYGTQTSKALIYNTWWFELIMLFFVINFFGNIFRYRLYKKEKWAVLLFHVSFLLILIGAGVTRYIGFEGMMIIDEGETTNNFLSEKTYLNLIIDNSKFQKENNFPLLLSARGKNSKNFTTTFQPKKSAPEQQIDIKLVDYIPWAEKKFFEDENGEETLHLVESSGGNRHDHYIKKGTIQNVHNILVGFNAPNNNASINIFKRNDSLKLTTKSNGDFMVMASQQKGIVKKDTIQGFNLRALYNVADLPFVVPTYPQKGKVKTIRGEKDNKKFDVISFDVTTNGKTERIELMGGQFNTDGKKEFSIGALNFRAWYGAKQLKTPFSVKLNDFQLEKYPGSESAASYASEVTVIGKDETFDFRIFMNHILDYKGYRLFQSSYKNAGEEIEQTHLSVNHDFWGTWITYIGYFMLFFGLIASLFVKNTHFDDLKKRLAKIRKKKLTMSVIGILFFFGTSFGQNDGHDHSDHDGHNHQPQQETHTTNHQQIKISDQQIDSILRANIVDKEHAEAFSKLVIQDAGGRMKPAHTFASELVRKIAQTEKFKGMTPSQVLFSITQNPRFWFEVPIIYLAKSGNKDIRETLDLPDTTKYARLSDFILPNGAYKIKAQVEEAQKTKIHNKFQTDLIKIDRRVGLLYSALSGSVLRIYPIPNHEENKWVSQPETLKAGFKGTDSVFVRQSLPVYLNLLQNAKQTGNYKEANQVLDGIKKFQQKFGAKVIPSQDRVDLEIIYNKVNIFKNLSRYYALVGVLLVLFVILQIFYSKSKTLKYIVKGLIAFTIVLFIMHILGLLARWYISGNAPWSNAYESLIFVAFATMLFGLFLGRRSALTIGASAFLVSVILMFAGQNWIDPEIANLQPVLNSWWLLVHTSIIVSAYGPFGLGMILGIVTLFLMVFTNKKNKKKMDINIKELTIINEMALTVGLVLFTIGNFLGGMWANESWGRYWGWDPKETWALISIMVYAFVLHMRLIPGLRGRYTFSLWSVIAFFSVMMTYMGVNFYLSGLHSYASGDKVITPTSVYYSIGFITILGTLAWLKYRKHYKKS